MEPIQIPVADGAALFTFDGRVFEFFGGFDVGGGHHLQSYRIHAQHLRVKLKGPDRKGRYEVEFAHQAKYPTVAWEAESESEFQAFAPLLDALRAAGVPFEP